MGSSWMAWSALDFNATEPEPTGKRPSYCLPESSQWCFPACSSGLNPATSGASAGSQSVSVYVFSPPGLAFGNPFHASSLRWPKPLPRKPFVYGLNLGGSPILPKVCVGFIFPLLSGFRRSQLTLRHGVPWFDLGLRPTGRPISAGPQAPSHLWILNRVHPFSRPSGGRCLRFHLEPAQATENLQPRWVLPMPHERLARPVVATRSPCSFHAIEWWRPQGAWVGFRLG